MLHSEQKAEPQNSKHALSDFNLAIIPPRANAASWILMISAHRAAAPRPLRARSEKHFDV
jgi:hypothetical protein